MTSRQFRHLEFLTCARAGLTQSQTASAIGVSRPAVSLWAKRHGVTFRAGKRGPSSVQMRKRRPTIRPTESHTPEPRIAGEGR